MHSAGPYCSDKILALGILAEVVVFNAFLINIIALFDLYACINDRHKVNAVRFHIRCKLFKIGETLCIDSKVLIAFHVVYIKINAIKGNAC